MDQAWIEWRDQQDVIITWCHLEYMIGPRLMGWDGRLVFASHGSGPWTKQYADQMVPIADLLIAVSQNAVKPFPEDCHDRVHVILNGVDLKRIETAHEAKQSKAWEKTRMTLIRHRLPIPPQRRSSWRQQAREITRNDLGITPDQIVVAHVGRFSNDKNPTAAAEAVKRLPNAVALYRVPEDQIKYATKCLRQLLEPDRFRVATTQTVADCYRAADVFLLASPSEGCSLSILEALATGTPVVCTDVGGIPDIERLGGKVVKVPIDPTPDQLAAAVREALARKAELIAAGLAFTARWNGRTCGQAWDALLGGP